MSSSSPTNTFNLYKYNEQVTPKFLQISSEFLNFLELNFFSYGFYKDGSHFTVTTNLEFFKHILDHKIFSTKSKFFQEHIMRVAPYQTRAFIYSGNPKDQLQNCFFNFNIWNYISFIYREEKTVYWWTFGTKKENFSILNEYMDKRIIFESFIKYFNHAASDFISVDEKIMIIHPGYKIPAYNLSCDEPFQKLQAKLLKDINSYANKKMHLTRREIECIKYLSQGKTAKEIANFLKLSPRTIEAYLQNARLRLDCSSKSHLIDLFNCYYP
jgi:DNA-binding CsgD family transcriptional regulator